MTFSEKIAAGTLYVIGTPIGNLNDISQRALGILNAVDEIVCEDTRVTLKLLQRFDLRKSLQCYQEYNERQQTPLLMAKLRDGKSIALLSDAGTPGISDPGFRIVRECRRQNIPVIPIPGPSAVIAALSASGLPTNGFLFLGFLPPKSAARTKTLQNFREFPYTLVLYESCHRVKKLLDEILQTLGAERVIAVAHELTKCHESFHVGAIATLLPDFPPIPKGEFVVIIAPVEYQL